MRERREKDKRPCSDVSVVIVGDAIVDGLRFQRVVGHPDW